MPVVDIWMDADLRDQDWIRFRRNARVWVAEEMSTGFVTFKPDEVEVRYHIHDPWDDNVLPVEIQISVNVFQGLEHPTQLKLKHEKLMAMFAPLLPPGTRYDLWITLYALCAYGEAETAERTPKCSSCGTKMRPVGSVYVCPSCGSAVGG